MEVWIRSLSFQIGDGCRFQPFIFQGGLQHLPATGCTHGTSSQSLGMQVGGGWMQSPSWNHQTIMSSEKQKNLKSPKKNRISTTFNNQRFQLKSIKQLFFHVMYNTSAVIWPTKSPWSRAIITCMRITFVTCPVDRLAHHHSWASDQNYRQQKKLSSKMLLGSTPCPRMQGCQLLLDRDY